MAALLRKDSWIDPSKRAEHILDYVLEDTSEKSLAEKEIQSPVEEELDKAPLTSQQSLRTKSRVLFITRDISILTNGSVAQLNFLELTDVFAEMHIMILSASWQTKRGVERIAKNVWVYSTGAKYWWQQFFLARAIAKTQLTFTDGFRPDIVVSLDPFEAGLCGLLIAEKYDREYQVHILEDFFASAFKEKEKINVWRLRISSHVLKRVNSVRVTTQAIKDQVVKRYRHIRDIALLPRHYNIKAIITSAESDNTADAFPNFSFVILFVGKLDYESTLFRALDACRSVLTAPAIGMVVLGDGPHKKEFQKRAEILGIKNQVIFEKDENKLFSYLKSADILICTDTTEASDEIVIKAAAAGLPLLIAETELRKDLFMDDESAFICNKEDTIGFSQKLVKFLNTNSLRIQFSTNAKDIIKTRLHEDPLTYKQAYKDSIEQVFSYNKDN